MSGFLDLIAGAVASSPDELENETYSCLFLLQNHIVAARTAFDSFFARYPYCYGYWKKYADMERRLGDMKLAEEVSVRLGKGDPFPTHTGELNEPSN